MSDDRDVRHMRLPRSRIVGRDRPVHTIDMKGYRKNVPVEVLSGNDLITKQSRVKLQTSRTLDGKCVDKHLRKIKRTTTSNDDDDNMYSTTDASEDGISEDDEDLVFDDSQVFLRSEDFVFSVAKVMEGLGKMNKREITSDDIDVVKEKMSDMKQIARKRSFRWKCLSALCDVVTLILPVLTVVLDVKEHVKLITVFTWVTVGIRIIATVFRIGDKGVIYNYIAIRYSQLMSKVESLMILEPEHRETRREMFIGILFETENLSIIVHSENASFMGVV